MTEKDRKQEPGHFYQSPAEEQVLVMQKSMAELAALFGFRGAVMLLIRDDPENPKVISATRTRFGSPLEQTTKALEAGLRRLSDPAAEMRATSYKTGGPGDDQTKH